MDVTFTGYSDRLSVMDPCAGEGVALAGLARAWVGRGVVKKPDDRGEGWRERVSLFGCEMEPNRAETMERAIYASSYGHAYSKAACGDAFLLVTDPRESVHVLYLNSPYDHDREHERLEERWLLRFGPMVCVGGALMFFVPFYALDASAETIAKHFEDPRCYRLPGEHFDAFKQVVLVARRRFSLATPDPVVAAKVRAWSADADSIAVLPAKGIGKGALKISTDLPTKSPAWSMGKLDLSALLDAYEPWSSTDRSGARVDTPNVEPTGPYRDLMAPRLRLACAPRPTHIAIAAGAGVLSGARMTPDAGQTGPELLLKGVHRRAFRHLRWKEAKGERVAEERQHHPELEMSILDLSSRRYHTLKSSVEPSGSADPAAWSVGDLLLRYSGSMLGALRDRCELLFDPNRPADVARMLWPVSPDPLLAGQENAVRGALRLLQEPDRAVMLLGEIGVGKTRISLTTAYYHLKGKGRIFVMCPPILLAEWESEVAKVLPDATFFVIRSIEDVDVLAAREPEGIEVVVISKEAAKLGHAWEGFTRCGVCGTVSEGDADKNVSRRLHCEGTTTTPANGAARVALRLVNGLGQVFADGQLQDVIRRAGGRILRTVTPSGDWRTRANVVRSVIPALRRLVARTPHVSYETRNTYSYAWWSAMHALADEALIVREARKLFLSTLTDRESHGAGNELRKLAARTLLLLPADSPWIRATLAEMASYEGRDYSGRRTQLLDPYNLLRGNRARRRGEKAPDYDVSTFGWKGGVPFFGERPWGSDAALTFAIERVCAMAAWSESDPCDAPLFQATARPRRVPIAKYITQRHPRLFDFMIIDEAHQYGTSADSAQSQAAQQLLSLRMRKQIPAMALTGSVMNGYARSLFVMLWHLSAAFRREFDYGDAGEFERRYGFLTQVVELVDDKKQRVVFGKQSDLRVTERSRTTGAAPGVLPTAILRYLLPISITIQLSDLELSLPPCRERIVWVQASKTQRERAEHMQTKLLAQMGADRFKPDLAGRLFGALAHLPRYYDLASSDTGNTPAGAFEIAYPEGTPAPQRVLLSYEGFDAARLLPGEKALIAEIGPIIAAGRNVVVATTRTSLAARLGRVIRTALGVPAAVLDAKKVNAASRRAWITEQREEKIPVLVCNPMALPVGLNNLVGYYDCVCIFDDPNNDPTLLRQFRGRFVRIGMVGPVDMLTFVYVSTLQEDANDLLQKKRVVATAADGLDASAAFEVAGVGESTSFESDLGKALYARLAAPS